jgi:SAM-dependent methyltransferase
VNRKDVATAWAESPNPDRYHPLGALGAYGRAYRRERLAALFARNEIRLDDMDILDLGCGNGEWCRFFADAKQTTDGIAGVEVADRFYEIARALSPIEYFQADMVDVASVLAGREFDFVSAFVSLMFLDRPAVATVLEASHALLRPGGFMLILERDEEHRGEPSGWPLAEMTTLALDAGFDVIDRRGLYRRFFGRFDSYYGVTFRRMDWMPALEHLLPGPWSTYFLLLKKDDRAAPEGDGPRSS